MLICSAYGSDLTVDLTQLQSSTLGKNAQYFQEQEKQLTINQAINHFNNNAVNKSDGESLSLGIAVQPVWLKIDLSNGPLNPKSYRLSIETPWLDKIDSWIVTNDIITKHVAGGDGIAYGHRPMQYRFYAFETTFPEGQHSLYLRIETAGPMAIPIRLSTVKQAETRDLSAAYQYGIIYGMLAALAIYNLILYVFIKQPEYGWYSFYLIGFILNSLSYTGQLHTIYTADHGPYFQDWVDISLMITYGFAGLHFARMLLNTETYAAGLDKFVRLIANGIPLGMLVCAVFGSLKYAMILAFVLNSSFAVLFVALGIVADRNKVHYAKLFIFTSVTAAVCIAISTLAVAGLLPYNEFTYKAIEVGITFEALFLAIILARKFRLAYEEKLIAELYARTDTLTELNNRRGFRHDAEIIWQNTLRNNHDISVILLDIDYFKNINDNFGHGAGDKVIAAVASKIKATARRADIAARWGGEEFILLLPETNIMQAEIMAYRLCQQIAELTIRYDEQNIALTASFGVAGTKDTLLEGEQLTSTTLESLIKIGDKQLYLAKNRGRNQVCSLGD